MSQTKNFEREPGGEAGRPFPLYIFSQRKRKEVHA